MRHSNCTMQLCLLSHEQGKTEGAPTCEDLPEGTIEIVGWPSKPVALVSSGQEGVDISALIFRSDSNGEDLDGCAIHWCICCLHFWHVLVIGLFSSKS